MMDAGTRRFIAQASERRGSMQGSIPNFLRETAQRLPDKAAVVARERSVTFSQLHDEALATAECLRELGIRPGDRVGICMEKTADQVSVLLGVMFANAVLYRSCRGSRDRTSATSSTTPAWRRWSPIPNGSAKSRNSKRSRDW
jgi:non-ribosomal peptide synthetase component F